MSYFYSQPMTYCECIMPREIAWDVFDEMGQLECVHFENKTVQYDNPYMNGLKRSEEAVSHIKEIKDFILSIKPDFVLKEPESYKALLKQYQNDVKTNKMHGHLQMNEIEDEIMNIHGYLSREKKELENINKQMNQCLIEAGLLVTLSSSEQIRSISKQKRNGENMFNGSEVLFDFKCLAINRKDVALLQRGLFRISRGNTWVKCVQINEAIIFRMFKKQFDFLKDKAVCIVMYQLGQSNTLLRKIQRYLSCIQFFSTDAPPEKWSANLKALEKKVKEFENLIQLTTDAIERYLYKLYEPRGNSKYSYLSYLQSFAIKQREIYRHLASTQASKSFLHFNVYVPTKDLPLNIKPSQKFPPLTLTPKPFKKQPPSKFDTPPIMEIPQQILNTYGVPSYRQFNPAVLYIVTFGFFIGVMFGDVGHMMMAVPFLVYFNVNIWAWTVIFFMGYCGFIYNQFFGLNLGLFSSCYMIPMTSDTNSPQQFDKAVRIDNQCVYPFGIDSIWKPAQNQMQFTNSLKMKIAVILGVTHMMLGLGIKIINGIRRRKYLIIFTQTMPQIIFMLCTFVYMDFLIIYKWNTNYPGHFTKQAPSIIASMISAFASFGDIKGPVFWPSEHGFETALFVIVMLMIPIMLLGVPIGTYIKRRKNSDKSQKVGSYDDFQHIVEEQHQDQKQMQILQEQMKSDEKLIGIKKQMSQGSQKPEQQSMQEIMVHQFIETIEYVLGTVSNTASYLRLWALSLAHGQLSEVIFELILKSSAKSGYKGIVPCLLIFPIYYLITFGVLICMDSMQCFLHSLRLHWVQFQNKFFQGTGYKFEPFNFRDIVKSMKQ